MKAVIVAAGISSRLYPLTKELPKCLLKVGGKTLIHRSVETLVDHGIDDICVVVGFQSEKLIEHLGTDLEFINNTDYENNNNMASLGFAKNFVNNKPFIYLHSDLLFHPEIITNLEPEHNDNLHMVDRTSNDQEAMKVLVNDGLYVRSNKDIALDQSYGEWLGISKFSSDTSKRLFQVIDELLSENNAMSYDTSAFNRLADAGEVMPVKDVDGLPWIEIDFHDDLHIAKEVIVKQL